MLIDCSYGEGIAANLRFRKKQDFQTRKNKKKQDFKINISFLGYFFIYTGNFGCGGGEDFQAYNWIINNGGLAGEYSYPYLGQVFVF